MARTKARTGPRRRVRTFEPKAFIVGMYQPNGELQVFPRPTVYTEYANAIGYALEATKRHRKTFIVLGVFATIEPEAEIIHARVVEYT